MPKYLVSISYSAEGAKGVRKDGGTKRKQVASKAIESLGGKLESLYFCFGDYDAVVIADMPDNASVAGLCLAVAGTGGASTATTVLLTPEEMDKAAGKKTAYKAPGA
jgi:uncharacterized protein with GYD domain